MEQCVRYRLWREKETHTYIHAHICTGIDYLCKDVLGTGNSSCLKEGCGAEIRLIFPVHPWFVLTFALTA